MQRCWSQFESRKKMWGAVRFEICDLILNPVYTCNLTFTLEIRAVSCSSAVSNCARLYIIILRIYFIRISRLKSAKFWEYLQVTRGALNPNLQVVLAYASHVCSQHSFGLPLRMMHRTQKMHRTQFDHARLDLRSLVIWSRVFRPSVTWNSHKAQRWTKSVLTFDRCRPQSVTFGYY